MSRDSLSLHAMIHQGLNNEVPESVLQQCAEEDKILIKNLLRVAQTEILVLNLASTSIVTEGHKTVIRCLLTGPSPNVSLSSLRSLQAYSPARVSEVRVMLFEGSLALVLEVYDTSRRMTSSEYEVIRIVKRRRVHQQIS